jgi:hypothetical protein
MKEIHYLMVPEVRNIKLSCARAYFLYRFFREEFFLHSSKLLVVV